jgi:integrase
MTARKPWSFAAGQRGRAHRVTVFENPQRDWMLMLRWTVPDPNDPKESIRKTESIGRKLRTAEGKVIREVERWAKSKAQEKHESLMRGEGVDATGAAIANAPLTIGETEGKLTDPRTGKYPTASQHRKETLNALDFARTVWSSARAWNGITKADIRALGRARIDQLRAQGHDGLAGAEHSVQRVLTVAQWLRDEDIIDAGAAVAPKGWKDELRTYWLETSGRHELPKPKQPRYTIEEAFRIIAAAKAVDPRLELVLWLAPNQRMKQVARVHRSHVDLDRAVLRIPSRGKKKGAVIALTAREVGALRDALTTGYLRELEAARGRGDIEDFPVFPAGQLRGGRAFRQGAPDPSETRDQRTPIVPVARLGTAPTHRKARGTNERYGNASVLSSDTIRDLFRLAAVRAKVRTEEGLGPYGVRRAFVDAAKEGKLSREGLTALGGWADPQMADRIYADQDAMYAAEEARDFRALLQEKFLPETGEKGRNPQPTTNSAPESESAVG